MLAIDTINNIKEIKRRLAVPYEYEEPYYRAGYRSQYRYVHALERSYYDVHGNTFEQDIRSYLDTLPDALKLRILKEIDGGMLSGNMSQMQNDYVFTIIDIFHFYYFGTFAC